MKKFALLALASTSVFAIASAAGAQTASAGAPAAAAADGPTLGEIVVTARRRSESLQEVPQTVNAVAAETLSKLNITQFSDVQNVVPGMNLQNRTDGYSQSASMRGVTYDLNAAAPLGTVAMYTNDAPVQAGFAFNALFDVGQIEVLRGPQGTTRGVSAPSGAMTVTTRKPDLSEFGGYINTTVTDQHGRNLQGALNIPIITDVLAVRVSGLFDDNDGDGVRSIHNALRQSLKTASERISVSFEPSDRFNANVMYQHTDKHIYAFEHVSGPGHTGPGAFVDPPLDPFDRASVHDGISDGRVHQNLVTAQMDSRIYGQHLSYVGSYQHTWTRTRNLGPTTPSDSGDILPGIELFNYEGVGSQATTHEIRLASDPAPGRLFDYTVGAYYSWQRQFGDVTSPPIPAFGAFGSPAGLPNLAAYDPRFRLALPVFTIPSSSQETSLFANVTLHLGDKTELTGGIRHMWSVFNGSSALDTGGGLAALPSGALGLPAGVPCSAAGMGSTYPGFCDVPFPGQVTNFPFRASETPTIYNVSLSHHFSRDLLVYATTGSSFRSAYNSPGIQSQGVLNSTNPLVAGLYRHPSEKTKSYELGVKWTFLDGRARLNADVYRQKFSNFTINVPNVLTSDGPAFAFTAPVDATVEGFEVDGALQITRDWNVGLQYSYADGRVENSVVPCNTFGPGGPVFNTAGLISFCPGGSASRQPYWNATLTSEYTHPVADNVDGFVRGLFSYYAESQNRIEDNFTVPAYGLLNLYAGVRSQDGAWEVSLFAKNALKEETVVDRAPTDMNLNSYLGIPSSNLGYGAFLGTFFPANSGYHITQVTPRREVGVNVRYAFGSR